MDKTYAMVYGKQRLEILGFGGSSPRYLKIQSIGFNDGILQQVSPIQSKMYSLSPENDLHRLLQVVNESVQVNLDRRRLMQNGMQ